MSCTFWVRRKRRAAAMLEKEKQQAIAKANEVAVAEQETVRKPRKKAVANNDSATD